MLVARTGAGSTGQRKKLGELLRWFHESERLARTVVEASRNRARSAALWSERSVLLGMYWRSSPLVFSFAPLCQGECGSQK